ncbi:Glycerophosphoryl diester phosphodiesterase family-domain-containing protein [Xylaria sp. FL1777]|nr:Glycerophosphoryl diester phosphodiesterase family-domain-containing protein [Xylaria sp. FL1777]
MRFGRELSWRQVPMWADSYINYDHWKYLAKAAKSQELKAVIARDSLMVENFLGHKYEVVAQHLAILNDQYGITLESWHQATLLRSVPDYEKHDIRATLTDICSLLISLSSYITVILKAVERISSKTTDDLYELESLGRVLQTATITWVNHLKSINSVLQNLHPTESLEEDSPSLLLVNHHSAEELHLLKEATGALRQDSAAALEECFQDGALERSTFNNQTVLLVLTKTAILCSSSKCLPLLVSRLSTIGGVIQYRSYNPLRLRILHAARKEEQDFPDQDAHRGVQLILDNLQSAHWSSILLTPDSMGRLALHYAAQYGMTATCKELIERVNSLQNSSAKANLPPFLLPDHLGETPLSIAISQGHAEIIKLFLDLLRPTGNRVQLSSINNLEELSDILISLAIRSQRTHITEILIDNEPQLLTQRLKIDELLYLASQYGQASIVEKLLGYTSDINFRERVQGRTPLMIASIYEHASVVELLLAHPSCDINVCDYNGWTAVDHAAFRGPPALVKTLQGQGKESSVTLDSSEKHINLPAQRSKGRNIASKEVELDTKMGEYSHIFMNLGHFDMEKESSILQIEAFRQLVAPLQIPDSSLTLEISGINCDTATPYVISFPILEDLSNDPLHFTTKDPDAAKLLFRVYSSVLRSDNDVKKSSLVGSAIASLKDAREGLGKYLESLERDYTVSLVSSDAFGSNYAGSFTFTFVIAKPFSSQGPLPTPSKLGLRRDDSPWIAGHRGLGQNNAKKDRLQLGENTMDSFHAALKQGADILEFGKLLCFYSHSLAVASRSLRQSDIQVTRDLTPVIYHDFLVSETGTDAPMHAITYEQFMVPSTMQDSTVRPSWTSDSLLRTAESKLSQRPRAGSVGQLPLNNVDVIARLMSTFNLHNFGFKGNVGSECIHGPFITLQQLLVQIDPSVCFDIELKYPMLFEARDFEMDTFAMELNTYLDATLAIVYRYGGKRPIFFSSFSPELCILLATKQQLYPVLFLTESGYIPTRDIRAISFQEAVRFARKWNLEGVVVRSQPIVASPRLVGLVKSSGLVCASWGDLNDDLECAKAQANVHLDVIITNRVGEVVRALNRR